MPKYRIVSSVPRPYKKSQLIIHPCDDEHILSVPVDIKHERILENESNDNDAVVSDKHCNGLLFHI